MIQKNYIEWKQNTLRSALEKKVFVSGQFELTGRCNLNCKMCYVHTLDHCAARQKELSTNEWIRVFDEAIAKGLFFATLTGGECLLRPDFKELYLYLWKRRVMVSVFTNGTMIDDSWVDFFKTYKPERIQISLYGSSEDGYIQVTGHRGFEKTTKAIRALKDAGIAVRVAITNSKYMKQDYIRILKYCRENEFPFQYGEMFLAPNRDDPNKNDYYLTMDEIVDLSVQRTAVYRTLEPINVTPEPVGNSKEEQKGLKCTAGNCLAYVTWDGKMVPCASAMLDETVDIRELGFAEAWERTKAAAAEILLPVECVGCPYEKVCVRCPMLRSPKRDGHCDPGICQVTRRLVAAGVKKLDAPEPTDPEHGV